MAHKTKADQLEDLMDAHGITIETLIEVVERNMIRECVEMEDVEELEMLKKRVEEALDKVNEKLGK